MHKPKNMHYFGLYSTVLAPEKHNARACKIKCVIQCIDIEFKNLLISHLN